MNYTIVGLGNPGIEYENTRHNAGRAAIFYFHGRHSFPDWSKNGDALLSDGTIAGEKALLLLPETYMNRSGRALQSHITSPGAAGKLVVIYDDIDLPLGKIKISHFRSAGGHKGLESIIRVLRTKNFVRIRIGIAGSTPTGKLKKPKGEEKVLKYLMSNFAKKEKETLKKVFEKVGSALEEIVTEGRESAMNKYN